MKTKLIATFASITLLLVSFPRERAEEGGSGQMRKDTSFLKTTLLANKLVMQ